jgi:pyruvate dehydrogenase E2 component (dihydrolipoamide acetyltransferase)
MADVVIMPKLGFDMAEGTLVRWVVLEGSSITKGAVLAEIETDKATVEVESTYEGVVLKHLANEGDILPINTPIAVIGAAGESLDVQALGLVSAEKKPDDKERLESVAEDEVIRPAPGDLGSGMVPTGMVRASPLARRMAKELGIDIRQVQGSGPGGRVVKADIDSYHQPAAEVVEAKVPPIYPTTHDVLASAPQYEKRADQSISVSRLRAAIGRRMAESKQQVPHFYLTREFDVTELVALRKQINTMLPENEKISVNDLIIKSVALALRNFPNLNASVSGNKNEIIQHGEINIGVAVAVDQGLLTVVCRNADQKSVRQIAIELRTLALRAREGKVRPDDIEGSTFSVSNLGMFDIEHFEAIINPPEAAILGVGAAREVPVVINGTVQPGVRMKATISVDHRISDGAEAARFLQELSRFLEEPLLILLN